MAIMHLTKDNFDSVTSSGLVLVDFWATWCGPCRMVAPIIDQLEEEYAGKIKVGKVNVDEQGELAARFGVMSIPTLIVFKNGEVAAKTVGVQPKQAVLDMLK